MYASKRGDLSREGKEIERWQREGDVTARKMARNRDRWEGDNRRY
jgi:hypothetical protein